MFKFFLFSYILRECNLIWFSTKVLQNKKLITTEVTKDLDYFYDFF